MSQYSCECVLLFRALKILVNIGFSLFMDHSFGGKIIFPFNQGILFKNAFEITIL